MSTNTSLFYVEHRVTNKQEWDDINSNYFKIMAAEDMTIDKGLKHPDLEGDNWGILSCSDLTGTFTVCIWQVPSHMTKQSFQEFIDRFTQGTAVNNVYSVQNILGNRLSPRLYMQDFINAARNKPRVPFTDREQLWFVHHDIQDKQGWEANLNQMTEAIQKGCKTPSDVGKVLPLDGMSGFVSLFLDDDTVVCIGGCPAGTTKDTYQIFIDGFVKGTAENTVYQLNPEICFGINNCSEDNWSQDFLTLAMMKGVENEDTPKIDPVVVQEGIRIKSQ